MALKRNAKGVFVISSRREAEEALNLIDELAEQVQEVEKAMEEEFDYSTMKKDATDLKLAVDGFMIAKKVDRIEMDGYRVQVVRRSSRKWNGDKLRALVDKAMWLKITRQEPDPEKIDELVREGKLDRDVIEEAFEEAPQKPHTRKYYDSAADEEDETERVKAALGE